MEKQSSSPLDSEVPLLPALIRVQKLADDSGITPLTIRNYEARGLLEIVRICGSSYVTGESLCRLIQRARKGEVPVRGFKEFFKTVKKKPTAARSVHRQPQGEPGKTQ